jgi:arylsulfatase A-like enzyme
LTAVGPGAAGTGPHTDATRDNRRRSWALLVFTLCGVIGCTPPIEIDPQRHPNILVILVDTLRADSLGTYGNPRGLTPFVDQLAARSWVFDQAYAQSSWTNPSVASLFTSRYQSQHHIRSFNAPLDASEVTLASRLRDHGYATGAVIANAVLGTKLGFERGFDGYRILVPKFSPGGAKHQKQRAAAVHTAALAWLDGLKTRAPVFLYLHYVEPHIPYSPPDDALDRVSAGRPRPNVENLNVHMSLLARLGPTSDETRAELVSVYDAEVTDFDARLRELFAALDKRGFLQHAVVVFTSDHGEEFGDHGSYGHGHRLFNELIRVPLIVTIFGPDVSGQDKPRRVGEVVSLTDVGPTLLELAAAPPAPQAEGHSLIPAMRRAASFWLRIWDRAKPTPAFSELLPANADEIPAPHQYAVVLNGRKLIRGPEGETTIYDLARDPGEQSAQDQDPQARLGRTLTEFVARMPTERAAQDQAPLDPEHEKQLRALGYVH